MADDHADKESEVEPLLQISQKPGEQDANEKILDKALELSGCGLFHALLLLLCSFGLASCTVQVYCVSFAIPVAEGELRLGGVDKAILNSSVFFGMLIGGLIWGSLADSIGRKKCLILALLLNSVSGLSSTFQPTLLGFASFRFLCGIGIDCVSVMFSYFSEFFSAKRTGPFVIALSMGWTVLTVYAPAAAWALLSDPCLIDTHLGSMPFRTWRVYVMSCSLPALLSAVLFIFMPESPSWHYANKRYSRAKATILTMTKINGLFPFCRAKRALLSVLSWPDETLKHNQVQGLSQSQEALDDSSSDEAKSRCSSCCRSLAEKLTTILKRLRLLFSRMYARSTILMLVAMGMQAFSYYGVQLWIPLYFKHLQGSNSTLNGTAAEGTCDVAGDQCSAHLSPSCSDVYMNCLLETAVAIPGTVLGMATVNIVGGRLQMSSSMLLSGASVLLIWWLPRSNKAFLVLACVYNAITIVAWNVYHVLSVDLFPTNIRSTAGSLLIAMGRIGSISANFVFGAFQMSDPYLPILIVAVCLLFGGLTPIFLPLSDNPDHRSLLGKLFMRWWEAVCRKARRRRSNYEAIS